MKSFSVKNKLIAILLAFSFVVLLLALCLFSFFEIKAYGSSLRQELKTLAQVLSLSSRAAISFQDTEAAERVLETLQVKPNIIKAAIYKNDDKKVFAQYLRDKDSIYKFNFPAYKQILNFDKNKQW